MGKIKNDREGGFFQSIRFRLTLWFSLILLIVLAAFSVYIYWVQARSLQADQISHMQDKFARVQAFFLSPDWQSANLTPSNAPGTNAPLQSGDLLILADTTGAMVQNWGTRPANPNSLINGLVSAASQAHGLYIYEQTIPISGAGTANSDRDYLFIISPVSRGDTIIGYLVIGSPSDLANQLHRLLIALIAGCLAMLIVAYLGGLWLADRAMRPVQAIRQAAQSISESDLSRRLSLRGRDELAQLAATFDGMLARLQAAFERQRRFTADASHELRTPLTIINLEAGRMLSGNRSAEEYRQALRVVHSEGERMSRLVDDLMTLARMDAGQTILQFAELDLSDISLEAVERMLPMAQDHNVALDVGEMPELEIMGDRQYLIQVVSNLIENGIKYGGEGKTVRVETEYLPMEAGAAALVRVSDSGPGIAADQIPHIFDRFYRVDEARSREPNETSASPTGSGLGLSIVAWIVRAHGGEIHVDSQIDRGTKLEVRLPLVKPQSSVPPVGAS